MTQDTNMEQSNYHQVRKILSASELIGKHVDKLGFLSIPPEVISSAQVAATAAKVAIYSEDWMHTSREIKNRINDVLSSKKLANAVEYPDLYLKFEKHVKTSMERWTPDRDYPQIGYFPKELLSDRSLAAAEITQYWPEATNQEQAEYAALTFDKLVLNYEFLWEKLVADFANV